MILFMNQTDALELRRVKKLSTHFRIKHGYFKNTFSSSAIIKWNKFSKYKTTKRLEFPSNVNPTFISSFANSTFNCYILEV